MNSPAISCGLTLLLKPERGSSRGMRITPALLNPPCLTSGSPRWWGSTCASIPRSTDSDCAAASFRVVRHLIEERGHNRSTVNPGPASASRETRALRSPACLSPRSQARSVTLFRPGLLPLLTARPGPNRIDRGGPPRHICIVGCRVRRRCSSNWELPRPVATGSGRQFGQHTLSLSSGDCCSEARGANQEERCRLRRKAATASTAWLLLSVTCLGKEHAPAVARADDCSS